MNKAVIIYVYKHYKHAQKRAFGVRYWSVSQRVQVNVILTDIARVLYLF